MNTPQTRTNELAKKLGLDTDLFLKREDKHKYGSHKGRSIPLMIKKYTEQGIRKFGISSSGNSALSAMHAVNIFNESSDEKIYLQVYVGKKIDVNKMDRLEKLVSTNITIEQVGKPKQKVFQLDSAGTIKSLRQSTDDSALVGYESLANELAEIKYLKAIFIPTSSGTTAEALHKYFTQKDMEVQIHIVQTIACHPIAEKFDTNRASSQAEKSIAGAIVDKVAHRKINVVKAIGDSGGFGWIVDDEEIKKPKMTQERVKI